jgi:drug/metabolite transporter (DMT)-like permease
MLLSSESRRGMRVILPCWRSSTAAPSSDKNAALWTQADIMSSQQLIRWGGLAAMLAGALRTAASFWPSAEPGVTLEILYLVIDILLLFGIFGIYAFQHERIGWFGFVGFLLAVIGTAIIAGPDGTIGVVDMYTAGSLSVGAGIVFLAVGSWAARTLPRGSRSCGSCQPWSVSSGQLLAVRVSSW